MVSEMLDENALSTSSYFYLLYKTLPQQNNNRQDETTQQISTITSINNTIPSSNTFWDEDEWTDQCEERAKQTLEKYKQKCQIGNDISYQNLHAKQSMSNDIENNCHHYQNIASYWLKKYEEEANIHWDGFYTRNQTNFFKDRHYLHKSFPNEAQFFLGNKEGIYTLHEIGCGVGNNILPLLSKNPKLNIHCFDFSSVAIELLDQNPDFLKAKKEGRASAHVWDITKTFPQSSIANSLFTQSSIHHSDCTMLLFCLSAIDPKNMVRAVCNIASILKPGGVILFRDYGRYDEAQMKLGIQRGKGLGENFYVKNDGTRCYYFDLNDLENIFGSGPSGAKLEILELRYIRRLYRNRGNDKIRRRVWVQGRFRKPWI